MEQTNDIDALMEKIQAQETTYEFDRIDEDLALQMGIYAITGSAARRTSYMRPMAVLTIGSAGARRAIILSSGVA